MDALRNFWKRQKTNFKLMVARDSICFFFGKRTPAQVNLSGYEGIYIKRLGATPVEIGLINSVVSLLSVIVGVPAGWIIDRARNVKKIYLVSLALGVPSSLLIAFAPNWTTILLILLLLTLTTSVLIPSQTIIDVDSINSKDRVYGLSIRRFVTAIADVISPLLIAYLVDVSGGIDSVSGIRPVFLLWFLSDVTILIMLFVKLEDVFIKRDIEGASLSGGLKLIFGGSTPLKIILVRDIVTLFVTGMSGPFTGIYQVDVKMASVYIFGLIGVAEPAVDIFFTAAAARLIDQFGRRRMGYLAYFFGSIARLVLVLIPPAFPELLILQISIGSIEGCLMLGFDAYNFEIIPQEIRGKWIGFRSLILGLIGVVSPILGGFIWNMNPDYLFWMNFLEFTFVAFPIMIILIEKYSDDGMVKSSS
jgi:MFS family permease